MPTHPRAVGLVWLGGTLGTGLRWLLSSAAPDPAPTLLINVVGAFALALLTARTRSGRLRLLVGTGLLGGFTTYSALALDTVELIWTGRIAAAAAYAFGTVLAGAAATLLGLRLGRRSAP